MPADAVSSSPFRRRLRLALALSLAAVLTTVVLLTLSPATRAWVAAHWETFLTATTQLGGWGPVAIGAAFIPVSLFFLPGSPVTLFGGFAFGGTAGGLIQVTCAVSVGSTLGATLAFLVGRTLAREWIEKRISGSTRFRAIDAAVARQGFKIVLLCRLSPVFPFNLLNYAFGLTNVSFRDYLLATWIGMFPGTVLFVYLGSTARNLADVLAGRVERHPSQQVLFYLGLAATAAVAIVLAKIARRALAAELPAA
jgi:uncharacterized membrane protein YdjX (TVP38/TMEM64 family)